MVKRSEVIVSGVIGILFLSVYQYALAEHVKSYFGDNPLGQILIGNLLVWLIGVCVAWTLLWQIKKRKRGEYAD